MDVAELDWKDIPTDIVGSLFQSIKRKEGRRQKGQHFTIREEYQEEIRSNVDRDDLRKELRKLEHEY